MRAVATLALANKESMHFFTKKLSNENTLYESANQKINLLLKRINEHQVCALLITYDLHETIKSSIDIFFDELDKFEGQLEKRKLLGTKKITFTHQYKPEASCSNPLAISLFEWVQVFDTLMSTLKLLNLSGCFESMDAFYYVKNKIQKKANRLISHILLLSTSKLATDSIQDALTSNAKEYDWKKLYDALRSPLSPGFSPQARNQILYQVKQKFTEKSQITIKEESST